MYQLSARLFGFEHMPHFFKTGHLVSFELRVLEPLPAQPGASEDVGNGYFPGDVEEELPGAVGDVEQSGASGEVEHHQGASGEVEPHQATSGEVDDLAPLPRDGPSRKRKREVVD